jgi:L-ascorbate metabolism protein UlaG (beta-lactamase superfamily)
MKIKHFLYNSFIIENEKIKIAIDPGLNMWLFKLGSLIPKSEWSSITYIFVTHGDPDHYWYTDKIAEAADAPIVCGKELVKKEGEKTFIVAPRGKDIQYSTHLEKVYPIDVGEVVDLDDVKIEGLKAVHGPLVVKFLGLKLLDQKPGPGERIGLGAIGFKINIGNKSIINLGDTLLQKEWEGLNPDILMIPIGGGQLYKNTMSVEEALEAVKMMSPKKVIPCHYNCGFLLSKKLNIANDEMFKNEVEKMGIECTIMKYGDEIFV